MTSVSCVFSQDPESYNQSGDPSERSWPGGYVSIAYEFDLKSRFVASWAPKNRFVVFWPKKVDS